MFPHLKELFLLRPDVHHLNHGSFGACPRPVFDEYQRLQLEFERDTVEFFAFRGPQLLFEARKALGDYIGCAPNDVVYTMNPSYAISIVAKSFPLNAGDEILATDLEYGAMDRTWNYYCRKVGAKYVQQKITLPVVSSNQIVEEFFAGLTPRTKAIFISQITSTTALRLPVEAICKRAKQLGLITIVDGAHVPGHIPLNLATLQADIYTGACHKWLLTPKGCSFLYVTRELQHLFDPLVISWGFEAAVPGPSRFIDYHQLQGTRDLAPFLSTSAAIQFLKEHKWNDVAQQCREVVRTHAPAFAEAANGQLLSPLTDEFMGQMCSVAIQCSDPMAMQRQLYEQYGIVAPVMPHNSEVYIRFSFNAYNTVTDLEALFAALRHIQKN